MSVRVWTIILLVLAAGLAYALSESILGTVRHQKKIREYEQAVIEQLKLVREAQKAYLLTHGYYAPRWEDLINYVKNDSFYVVQKTEKVTPRDRNDKDWYKGDIITVTYDTLQRLLVKDYLFPADKYPNLNLENLGKVPNREGVYFKLMTRLDSSKGKVAYIEVVDTVPFDKTRSEDNDNPRRRFLRFGSLDAVTLSGNWE